LIQAEYLGLQIGEAERAQVISKAEANSLRDYHEKVAALLDVDDFARDEFLGRTSSTPDPAPEEPASEKPTTTKTTTTKKAAKKTASRKKTSKKKTSKA
jgi:hypothetical protein